MSQARADDLVKSEAMDWVLRRDAGPLSASEAEAFEAWLSRSPAHREMFASTDAFWSSMADLDSHPRMPGKRTWALAATGRARLTRRVAAAAVFAGVLGAGGVAAMRALDGPKPLATQAFVTAVGQRATVTLPDGSTVTLNTDTRVRTVANRERRVVHLDKGQAFFRVAKDARRPFVVTAGGRTVTALGTAFEVRLDDDAFKVVLVEGRVRVQAPRLAKAPEGRAPPPAAPISTDMSAGSQLVAADDADWRVMPVNAVQETSWLSGQLIFDDEALGDVVAELNRYSPRKMVFADPKLAEQRISGVYTPGDVQAFSLALKDARVADVRERSGGQIEIVALK